MRLPRYHSVSETARAKPHLVSFDEASGIISSCATPLGTERVALEDAEGRILATDAIALCASPAGSVSAMDGYAVRDSDLKDLPVSLDIAGKSFAGKGFDGPLPPHSCVRIFTGAPAPAGTDRVVMQEDVRQEGATAILLGPLSKRRHLRLPGADFRKGDMLVPAGSVLTPQCLIGVAASDHAEVDVFRRPRVAILCCGDELAAPGDASRLPDSIPESISYGIAALVRRWGGEITARSRLPDDLTRLQAAAAVAISSSDVVVIIGGASVGEKDLAKDAFAPVGLELLFAKVAIKPGKPVWFGRAGKTLVVGLPGNPTSALVTARLFLAPLLAGLSGGRPEDALDWRMMRANMPVEGSDDRDVFMRATIQARSAVSLSDQDSASQRALAEATHLIRRRRGEPSADAQALVETLVL